MLHRLALLTLLGTVCACDAPPPGKVAVLPAVQDKGTAAAPSQQQVHELSEQCAQKSRDQFRRDWKDGGASFSHHYNAKRATCFYLLTIHHSTGTHSIMFFDIATGELYGEYLGPESGESPATCRIESLYCASRREWEVLIQPYMEE